MNEKIKVGIIGVGHLGQYHVKQMITLSRAATVSLYDADRERAAEIARQYQIPAFNTLPELLAVVDAVSIVTPTPTHAAIARQCLQQGKHVFIEKPITKTVAEADELIELSQQQGVLLQVGHIERLNPALLPLKEFDLRPKFIEVQRLAPYTVRGTDVPVVLDLMIHDIDIVLSLVDSPVKNIRASGVSIMTKSVDIANARIRFRNGAVASITASRIANARVRKIKIFQQDMYATIDLSLGLTEIYRILDARKKDPAAILTIPLDQDGTQRQIVYEKPPILQTDALRMELDNFLAAIQGVEKPIVDGPAGRDALAVAIQIHQMIVEDLL
ncbi:MAG: Gfo/Idh/MocA family oxidoreductase [Candidatus Neomarinimicrobiota bacterium]